MGRTQYQPVPFAPAHSALFATSGNGHLARNLISHSRWYPMRGVCRIRVSVAPTRIANAGICVESGEPILAGVIASAVVALNWCKPHGSAFDWRRSRPDTVSCVNRLAAGGPKTASSGETLVVRITGISWS
jgi:hypothetical protein